MGRLSQYFDINVDAHGNNHMEVYLDGIALLRLVLTNKGTAFTTEERLKLRRDLRTLVYSAFTESYV